MHSKSSKNKYSFSKSILLIIPILLVVIIINSYISDNHLSIKNVKWASKENSCNVKFQLINDSQNEYKVEITVRAFSKRDRALFLTGQKIIKLIIHPQSTIDHEERVEVNPFNRTKEVQLTIDNVIKL